MGDYIEDDTELKDTVTNFYKDSLLRVEMMIMLCLKEIGFENQVPLIGRAPR